jgi:hypothetical protein
LPNRFDGTNDDYQAVDANLWFIIACRDLYHTTGDNFFLRDILPKCRRAFDWIRCHDIGNKGLLVTYNGMGWMDATVWRSGYTAYMNVLYWKATQCMVEMMGIDIGVDIKAAIDSVLWTGNFYASHATAFLMYPPRRRIWYNCPVLANCLAVKWGMVDEEQAAKIVAYLDTTKVAEPYPAKAMTPPTKDFWHSELDTQSSHGYCGPHCYHNGGIWPFIGAQLVLAQVDVEKRSSLFGKLAEACYLNNWEFNEWLHGQTGEPLGASHQGWSASGYIEAYEAVKGDLIE